MQSWRWYSKVLFSLLVAAFAYFVWPTPWWYDHFGPDHVLVRFNRVTGQAQFFVGTGWATPAAGSQGTRG